MADYTCLAIDAMGGDFGSRVTVPAAVEFIQRQPSARVILYGDESEIKHYLPDSLDRLSVIHCAHIVENDEKPSVALRQKRESSMWMAVKAVADGDAGACVSAGNTGALMAMGLVQLRLFPGIERPAICAVLPSLQRRSYLLDAGGNLECSANQLHQFAAMASCLVRTMEDIAEPTVGILNVGSEEQKGVKNLHEAADLISADSAINYCGFVEGDDIYLGRSDVVVCDGFSGNVALKAGEGTARMITERLRQAFKRTWYTQMVGAIAGRILLHFRSRIDPAAYNGASFLGLRGVVVKSHGSASEQGFVCALEVALEEAKSALPRQIEQALVATTQTAVDD